MEGDINMKSPEPISLDIHKLIYETIKGELDVESLESKLNELSQQSIVIPKENNLNNEENNHRTQDQHHVNNFVNLLADVLVQCEFETSVTNREQRANLLNIIKALLKSKILPISIALERFDIELNHQLGIVGDKKLWMTGYNRLRTKLYFKQKKFNLLREENEGFAKIIASLSQLDKTNQTEILKTVTTIIGKYHVDPNRVLDLIMDVFEFNSFEDSPIYVEILNAFYKNTHKILQLVILRLNFYTTFYRGSDSHAPHSFYRMIAILIHEEIIDIDDIYPYLAPSDAKILDYHKKMTDEAKAYSKKYAMAVVGEEKTAIKSFRDDFSAEDKHFLEIDNQKTQICANLMEIGDWERALDVARKLPEYYCFSNPRISTSACVFINYLIDPIYRECALPKSLNSRIRPILPRENGAKQIKDVHELRKQVFPMLMALGPFLSADCLLLTKIIRILKHLLFGKQTNQAEIVDSPLYYAVLDVINESILPSMSLSGKNCCLVRELWSLLKNFKYSVRYQLYYHWRDDCSNAALLNQKGDTLLMAKHHMKRLSKDTIRPTARHIGKLCTSNPIITLNYILVQIQSYDNLIGLVVDALRYLSPLAIDSLIYCIIEMLADPSKNKKSPDGMALASWLTSISTFSANIILRYKVEFTSFLEYIAHQLEAGLSLDLVLLTDLIQKMTGIETIQAMTEKRMEALKGGDVLRTECAYFNQIKNTRKSSARLKDALIESGLAARLCILMAQLSDSLCFVQQDGTPLKLVGKLYDKCQETLVQYGVFLSMNLKIEDYIRFMPSLNDLMVNEKYRLNPDSAFILARPMIFHRIESKFIELREAAKKNIQVEEGEAPEMNQQALSSIYAEAAKFVIDSIASTIKPHLDKEYNAINLNAKLFVIFWTLSISDIEVPVSAYEGEIQRLSESYADLSKTNDDDIKKRKEKERCNNLIIKLKEEQAHQIERVEFIRTFLESEKHNLFWVDRAVTEDVYLESRQFVQHCPYSRSLLTASDAIYSARFFFLLHELEVKDYPTIICLDRLLCDLTYMISACTENEANHFGKFLCKILEVTKLWHSDIKIFNQYCENKPGSIINREQSEYITYEKFRDICYKWHYKLTRSFTISLESNNYVQIRNALIVMIEIKDCYPAIKHFNKGIKMKIEDVKNAEKDSRQDLFALASAYAGLLNSDSVKNNLKPEDEFHIVEPTSKSKSTSSNSHRERHSSSSSRKRARHS